MNFSTLTFLFKTIFVISLALFFVQCQDDPARQAATRSAMETPAQPQGETPPPPSNEPVRPATSGTLTLNAGSYSISKGSEVCVPVTAQDFIKIVSMQYTMQWDPKVLKYKTIKGAGLPGLAAGNFGTQATAQGILTFSWYDAEVKGISYENGHKLYDVCFDAIGAAGSKSKFEFADAPVIIEITNAASQFLDLNGTAATVEVR